MSEPMQPAAEALSPLKRALVAIDTLQARVRALEAERVQPIAIVGSGCRLPGGGDDPESFFQSLLNGVDAIRPLPPVARPGWPDDASGLPPAGYLDGDVGAFDAAFFGISPREAVSIDPQHRLALECAWEALESAGIDPRGLEGSRTGVFVGMAANDYAQMQLRSERANELLHSHFASGIGHSMVSGRISYVLGLQGPSITVDTACSSSLVSVHLACQSLRAGESDLAIAAGVNLILSPDYTIAFQQSRMLSADGRCRTFDAQADGFSRGEGCGVVVLKRLPDAQRDGDRILAVIRATAVNQDGPSSGLTAPNGPAQTAVVRTALRQAGLAPSDIGYIETHGTATSLGDPIEVQALGAVFNDDRDASAPLLIGSVKTNLGHLEAAAGVAGLLKLVESVRRGVIPPHLHFHTPSPHIPWNELKVAVPTRATPFPVTGGKRRGGVSSFGFSGTNVHVIVEEAPAEPAPVATESSRDAVLTLSAADEPALRALAAAHAAHLRTGANRFDDVTFTTNVGRAHMAHRLALVAGSSAEAADHIESWLRGDENSAVRAARLRGPDRPPIAFLFTGQGAQHAGMGWALRARSAAFRRAVDVCDEILRGQLERPLLEILDPASTHSELVNRTDFTQPALFALQYALTELWRSRGIVPAVVAGHSIGEYAAAHLAGVLSLEDALRLVTLRGRLMQDVSTPGRMEAVFATEDRVREWLAPANGQVSIAGVNAPDQIVVSGAADAIEAVLEPARRAGVTTRPLRTSQAFHSPLMDGVASAFRQALQGVTLRAGRNVRFVSTLTGALIEPEQLADREYWVRQLREPVRFADAARGLAQLAGAGVEIGPHPSLAGLVAQNGVALPVFASLQREKDDWRTLLAAHRDLYLAGASPDWKHAAEDEGRTSRRVALPTYPFQRIPLWVDLGSGRGADVTGGHPLLGRALPQPGTAKVFERTLRADSPAFIGEHEVMGRVILPGTAYLEMAFAAARQLAPSAELRDVDLVEPMVFGDGERRRVHTTAEPEGADGWKLTVHSAAEPAGVESPWTLHAIAHLAPAGEMGAAPSVDELRARCTRTIPGTEFHASLRDRGYLFGPRLGGVVAIHAGDREVLAEIGLPAACADDAERYVAHPLILDAGLQTVSCALATGEARAYLPMAIGRARVVAPLEHAQRVHARVIDERNGVVTADATFLSADGSVLGVLERVLFREVAAETTADPFLEVRWVADARTAVAEFHVPAAVVQEVVPRSLGRLAAQEKAADYDRFVAALEAESGTWVRRAFIELGWDYRTGDALRLADLVTRFGVIPSRERLLARALDILVEEGVLKAEGDAWRVREPLTAPDAPPALASANGVAGEQVLLRRCGPALASGLRGTIDPLELLFPGGDGSVAEEMYYDAPLARMLNGAIADALAELLERLPEGRVLRVLEVGGGTAGTTRRVVDRLYAGGAAPRIEYVFTDVSPMFVERARRRFGNVPGFSFGTLDLDRAPGEQGFAAGSFDVVIAANCLHAARDLTAALEGMAFVLRPGGALLAAEVFAPHRWFDLTVGLTDGWWHFTDTELRPRYTCVDPATWTTTLARAGFANTSVLPLAQAAATTGHASRHQGLVVSFRSDAPVGGPRATEAWLLVSDDSALAYGISEQLASAGATVDVLMQQDLTHTASAAEQIAGVLNGRERWSGVVQCATDAGDFHDRESLGTALRAHAGTLLSVAKAVATASSLVPRLCLVTRAAQVTGTADADVNPVAAGSWGLLRGVAQEMPRVFCGALDLDAADPSHAARIAEWIRGEHEEPEAALRAGTMLVPRLAHRAVAADSLPAEYRLVPSRRGSIDDLSFSAGDRRAPGDTEVEIRVAATALNFKDVLNVLGLYPGDPGPLGSECAGVVTRVGANVRHVRVGDAVIAAAGGAYGRHVIAEAGLVATRPAGVGFAEAATLPIAYLTAHFALNHLGALRPDDRVLIHAAAGGVGLAACHLAKLAGAEIFATAGSDAKRQLLRDMGIRHVFDSRSLAFADDVMSATGGQGVTVVLNSLADEFVGRTFDVIARGGRFLEIGKRGIWTPEQVAALGRDIEYHVIDWGATAKEQPALVATLFAEVMSAVDRGDLPPLPRTEFALDQVHEAFRYMAQGRHTGKIVLRHPVQRVTTPLAFRGDASYLITGGTTGLGLATARWALERGARTIVLVSRREPSAEAAAALDQIRAGGAAVHVWRADVGDDVQVRALVQRIAVELPPLRGIVHAAGALADRTLEHITWADFESVLNAKAFGTVALMDAARAQELDFFVAYSSMAGVFGSPGQSNHSAANAFLDAVVARDWAAHAIGMSIAWGPWSEIGAAVRTDVLQKNRERGLEPLTAAEGLQWLERAFERPARLLVGARIARPDLLAGSRTQRLVQDLAPATRVTAARTAPASDARALPFAEQLAAVPAGARRAFVTNRVKSRVRKVLGLPAEAPLDEDRPLGEMGLDSLLAVELRNVLGEDVDRRLPATLLFDHPTTAALTDHLLALLEPKQDAEAAPVVAPKDALSVVDSLSDDDVDRLLAEKLLS